jgi:Leucine rich repeat
VFIINKKNSTLEKIIGCNGQMTSNIAHVPTTATSDNGIVDVSNTNDTNVDVVVMNDSTPINPSAAGTIIDNNTVNIEDGYRNDLGNVHAVAVQPMTEVDVETLDPLETQQQQQKKQYMYWWLLCTIMIGAIAGIGGYCGAGKCSSSESTTPLSPIDASYKVACDFLRFTSLSTCLTATSVFRLSDYVASDGQSIPTEIGLLTQLTDLTLGANGLMGTIPSSLGLLTQLTGLSLNGNGLIGSIPSSLGNLIQLTSLDFFNNELTGTIPSSLGNLVQLTLLGLNFNNLIGTIPSLLSNLSQLTYLDLGYNEFTGTIPSFLKSLTQLTYLDFGNNGLTGTIASLIGNLTQLSYLHFGNNSLTGTIPLSLHNLTVLNELLLYNNPDLRGTIPSSFCSISNFAGIIIDCDNIVCTCCKSFDTLEPCP